MHIRAWILIICLTARARPSYAKRNEISYEKLNGTNEEHEHDAKQVQVKSPQKREIDDEPMPCTVPNNHKKATFEREGKFWKKLSVQSLQLWEISPTSSILILWPAAIGGGSPFCPGNFTFGSIFDPLRPLSRDLPLSIYSPSIGPTPSACVFASLMFKIGRLSLRSRREICEEERDRSEDTRDMDREVSL